MRDKILLYGTAILATIALVFFTYHFNFGIASFLCSFILGSIGIPLLVNRYQVAYAKKLTVSSALFFSLAFGYYWGGQAFLVGVLVACIGAALIWKLIKSPKAGTAKPTGLMRRRAEPYFAGKGTNLDVAGFILTDPLIYVIDAKEYADFEASLLCLRGRIASPQKEAGRTLPYWPRLRDFQPHQIGNYLQWLSTGRKDPEIEMGYVFIYFYGLERRVFVDQEDIIDVGNEILRLLTVYKESRSFCHYATGLFIHLILLGLLTPQEKLIDALIRYQEGHLSDAFQEMLLGCLAKANHPLPAKWAVHLAQQDERTKRSVVLTRAYSEFYKLFALRYKEKFCGKLVPKIGSRERTIPYHAASPSLLRGTEFESTVPEAVWPSTIGWKQQFGPVIRLFNDCIEELKTYSRKTKITSGHPLVAYESLPKELQDEYEHPQQEQWDSLLEEYASEEHSCLIPISRIADLRSIEYRARLTMAQSKSIALFAEALGASVEPDPRYTQRSYCWDDHLAVLRLPDEPTLPEGQNYALVNLLMPLAIEVSLASGAVEEEERRVILEYFQERFMLVRNDRLRLDALIDVTLKSGASLSGVKKKISDKFSIAQRVAIGKFLVTIAGAADGVCAEEVTSLKKTFKSLGLEVDLVAKFIKELGYAHPESTRLVVKGTPDRGGEALPAKAPVLDIEKIRRIHKESIEASKLLLNAMEGKSDEMALSAFDVDSDSEAKDDTNSNGPAESTDITLSKLLDHSALISSHTKPFLKEVISKREWADAEFRNLARKHNITISAALEEINTWSDEALGDFLIEEGNPVTINLELLGNLGESP